MTRAAGSASAWVALLLITSILGISTVFAQQPDTVDEADKSPTNACGAIHHSLKALAEAEDAQAFALKLYSGDGQLPIVETRYHRLKQASAELREVLRRVHAGPFATDSSVAECLKLGYQNLFTADKVTSAVERILIEARGQPLAQFQEFGK